MNQVSNNISGVILAGGRAKRMHGQDKGLINLAGRPMIEWVIEVIKPQVDELLINANRNRDTYANYGLRIIKDSTDDYDGPLAGIAAGITAATSDLVLTVPCDSPLLPTDLASRLKQSLIEGGKHVAVAHDGKRMQPVFALFRKEVLQDISDYLDAGEHKLQLWMEQQRPALADFSDNPLAFTNVNTPDEILRIEHEMTSRQA